MFNFFKTYKTTVTGQFFCKYNPFGFCKISIHEKSYIYKETKPISVLTVAYGSVFTLKGRVRSFRKPSKL
uniref:Uncharacterized protein n=1 Tax=Strongyloides venezuelensis TaxID=75913 RepID=A0A0K0FX81_STRVS